MLSVKCLCVWDVGVQHVSGKCTCLGVEVLKLTCIACQCLAGMCRRFVRCMLTCVRIKCLRFGCVTLINLWYIGLMLCAFTVSALRVLMFRGHTCLGTKYLVSKSLGLTMKQPRKFIW